MAKQAAAEAAQAGKTGGDESVKERWLNVGFEGKLYIAGQRENDDGEPVTADLKNPLLEGSFILKLADGRVASIPIKTGQRVKNKLARAMMAEVVASALGALGQ